MAGRKIQVSAEQWLATARAALVEDGVAGLKVDRLASRLKVTRGGFYYHFRDRTDLLDRLLVDWRLRCRFTPLLPKDRGAAATAAWLDAFTEHLVAEDGYDAEFDMAVREWARSDAAVADAVGRVDRARIQTFMIVFRRLGYTLHEAYIRARVFYYHHIGYYSIGVKEPVRTRLGHAPDYLEILCGERLAAARAAAASPAASPGSAVKARARSAAPA